MLRQQRTISEQHTERKKGLSFEDFIAYKKRCLEPNVHLDEDHFFYDFDLKAHNANAEQMINLAEKKRIEAETPKGPFRRPTRSVKPDPWRHIYSSSTTATSNFMTNNKKADDYSYASPVRKDRLAASSCSAEKEEKETDLSQN